MGDALQCQISNVLKVSRSYKPYTYFYQLCNTVLEEVYEFKYLGVTSSISEDFKWGKHIDIIFQINQIKSLVFSEGI